MRLLCPNEIGFNYPVDRTGHFRGREISRRGFEADSLHFLTIGLWKHWPSIDQNFQAPVKR